MSSLPWAPWHQVVQLRDDLKSGELSLSMFAADLYDVVMGKGARIYYEPREFFALTYPTFNLRELAKDIVTRLAGKNDGQVSDELALRYSVSRGTPMRVRWSAPSKERQRMGAESCLSATTAPAGCGSSPRSAGPRGRTASADPGQAHADRPAPEGDEHDGGDTGARGTHCTLP